MTAALPDPAQALAAHLLDNPGDRLPGTIADVLTGGAEMIAAEAPELAAFLFATADAVTAQADDQMTAGQVAKLLGIHLTEVGEWEQLGRLTAEVIPGGWHRYAGAEVRALLAGGVR